MPVNIVIMSWFNRKKEAIHDRRDRTETFKKAGYNYADSIDQSQGMVNRATIDCMRKYKNSRALRKGCIDRFRNNLMVKNGKDGSLPYPIMKSSLQAKKIADHAIYKKICAYAQQKD